MKMKPALTSADVAKMMAACKAEAAKHGWKVSIAIVDDGGDLLHFERPDDLRGMTAEMALGKARTAARTQRPSKASEDQVKLKPGSRPNLLPMQGAVPLIVQGTCVGAIGCSGAASQDDEQIAAAGAAVLG